MKHRSSRQLFDYWTQLRGNRSAPERGEIDPSHIREILGDTFILEVTDSLDFVYRLAGTRICSAYCRELKERSFLSLWSKADRNAVTRLLEGVRNDGAVAVIGARGFNNRQQDMQFEIVLMPLSYGDKAHNRVLGSHSVAEVPYWFGSNPVLNHEIVSMRLIWPEERPAHLRQPQTRNYDEIPAIFPVTPSQRRGHLLVYDGGKSDNPN